MSATQLESPIQVIGRPIDLKKRGQTLYALRQFAIRVGAMIWPSVPDFLSIYNELFPDEKLERAAARNRLDHLRKEYSATKGAHRFFDEERIITEKRTALIAVCALRMSRMTGKAVADKDLIAFLRALSPAIPPVVARTAIERMIRADYLVRYAKGSVYGGLLRPGLRSLSESVYLELVVGPDDLKRLERELERVAAKQRGKGHRGSESLNGSTPRVGGLP